MFNSQFMLQFIDGIHIDIDSQLEEEFRVSQTNKAKNLTFEFKEAVFNICVIFLIMQFKNS